MPGMRIAASQLRVQGCLALTHMSNGEKRHFETDQGINQSQRHVFGISIRSDYKSVPKLMKWRGTDYA
jgi:hypothetical protein